ncbi:MAG: 1-(5-phosphoribosyl)-5-[Clostridia bacterium]|nr:1-(5-phosphoribosyl)-5-[(5-phosphoribosylamino)methylideneamino]imidazole-4-carboxamide isomerase [Clostridia bacterium]
MNIFPAIDLFDGKGVRLLKGNYEKMTVYSENPIEIARDFESCGAKYIHMVDLEGAKDGSTPNLKIVEQIAKQTNLFVEIGGGIRNMETADKYINCGVKRIILGTAAINDREFLIKAIEKHGDKVAVGVDINEGCVAIKGWTETSNVDAFEFCKEMETLGVKNIICTDISKDGAMQGTNRELYKKLSDEFTLDITASGGVTDLSDIIALNKMNLYGVIIGKAYYTGAIKLKDALEAVK